MSDLVPNVEVSIAVPEKLHDLMQQFAGLLNEAIADDHQYQLAVQYQSEVMAQVSQIVASAAAAIEALIDARDDALAELDDAIIEKEAAEEELADLERDIDRYYFSSNPKILDLVQSVQEDVWDAAADEYGYDHEHSVEEMTDSILHVVDVPYSDAVVFARAFIKGDVTWEDGMWDREAFKRVLVALHNKYGKSADNG